MRPIPTSFNIGPLTLHTYGIGLALSFYVAWLYLVRRTREHGYPTDWLVGLGVIVAISAVVGARLLHILTNLSAYRADPLQVFAIWHGGLSSFGGLLLAVPAALWWAHRKCPEVGVLEGLDIAMPALAAGWCLGRLLGPQLMVAGGGHATTQWFGMYYAGQVGRRIPVPIIQSIEDGLLLLVLVLLDRRLQRVAAERPGVTPPVGAITAVAMVVWGIDRALDERLWLGEDGHFGSLLVQYAGVALAVGGIWLGIVVIRRWRAFLAKPAPEGIPGSPQLNDA
jgi:phosphatidylglycerol:prolipoprotein diacylglycerol transferase